MISAREERRLSGNLLFRVSGYMFGSITLLLPFLAFVICVGLSIVYDFEASTATHCHVKNYLPSISASIGGFTPQRYIWRICTALHSAPRFVVGFFFLNYYLSLAVVSKKGLYRALIYVNFVFYNLENFSLLMLTNVSSTENHSVHEDSFIAFMVFSLCHMLTTCILMSWGHRISGMPERIAAGYKWKKRYFATNAVSFLLAVYFFFRHNKYCEPGVYTLFAGMEYITITTNILFHGSAILMFGHGILNYIIPKEASKKMP